MANFFLDTSALAKLYHKELGSDHLERVLQQSDNRLLISRLSIVEMEAVLAIKVRSGQLNNAGMEMPEGGYAPISRSGGSRRPTG